MDTSDFFTKPRKVPKYTAKQFSKNKVDLECNKKKTYALGKSATVFATLNEITHVQECQRDGHNESFFFIEHDLDLESRHTQTYWSMYVLIRH